MLLLAALLCTLEDRVHFGLEVRPILARRCSPATDPTPMDVKPGLPCTRPMMPEVITPGQPDASELFRRLITTNPHERMPEDGPTPSR